MTRINCLTAGHIAAAMLPPRLSDGPGNARGRHSDNCMVEPQDAKILWIHNTLDLSEVECSAAYWEEAAGRADLEILTEHRPLPSTRRAICRWPECAPWPRAASALEPDERVRA